MLKKRIIGVVIVKDGLAVQSIGFKRYLPVGNPKVVIEYLNKWGVDEITLLDIDACTNGVNYKNIKEYDKYCQVPLSIGGGIRSIENVDKVIQSGADKVVINSAIVEIPDFLQEASNKYGRQCIVASIDALNVGDGEYMTYIHSGKQDVNKTPAELSVAAEKMGAGEILINSIDRDGSKKGYDLDLAESIINAVDIPVVLCGGVGHPEHFVEGMRLDLSGVAAANYFNYTEHSVIVTKSFIKDFHESVRLDTYSKYKNRKYDVLGRAAKIADDELDQLRFEYIPEEVI